MSSSPSPETVSQAKPPRGGATEPAPETVVAHKFERYRSEWEYLEDWFRPIVAALDPPKEGGAAPSVVETPVES